MACLTTGLINNMKTLGVRRSLEFSVRISNPEPTNNTIRISGFYWTETTKKEYVLDILTLAPGEALERSYYAEFDTFEFQFVTSTDTADIKAWGKDGAGNRTEVHCLLPTELLPIGKEGSLGATALMNPSALNRIYVLNSGSTSISVIDGTTNTFLGNVIVGAGPYGIGVDTKTNRIFVANFGSHNVSVIDGNSNAVITTIAVGINPVGVGINSSTNKIYVTNWGSNSVSVIDGFTHVVIATISVSESPAGVNVNSVTNQIYITNHGCSNVSVIDGSNNTVIAAIEVDA